MPEHREALGDAGRYYTGVDGLRDALQALLDDDAEATRLREAAQQRARELYSWDAVAADYERWFEELVKGG